MNRINALQNLGRDITPAMVQGTIALFAENVLRPTPDVCSVERDIAYGSHERHRLDVFKPVTTGALRPVLVFVHGGGFVGGDKGAPDAPFYNNIGAWAAQRGYLGATMAYRLAPVDGWPAGSDDVASAVKFLRGGCSEFGGDPDAIFVMGQSAGASHVAGYVAHSHYGAIDSIAGAILMSGIYDLTELRVTPMERAYFGTDEMQYPKRSMVGGLIESEVPCLLSVAQMDPDHFQQQTGQVIKASLASRGRLPQLHYCAGHNHVSPAMQIGGTDDDVGPSIARFIGAHALNDGSTLPAAK